MISDHDDIIKLCFNGIYLNYNNLILLGLIFRVSLYYLLTASSIYSIINESFNVS